MEFLPLLLPGRCTICDRLWRNCQLIVFNFKVNSLPRTSQCQLSCTMSASFFEVLSEVSSAAELHDFEPVFHKNLQYVIESARKHKSSVSKKTVLQHTAVLSQAVVALGELLRKHGKAQKDFADDLIPLATTCLRALQCVSAHAAQPSSQVSVVQKLAIYCGMAEQWTATLQFITEASNIAFSDICTLESPAAPNQREGNSAEGSKAVAAVVASFPMLLDRMGYKLPPSHANPQFARDFSGYLQLSRAAAGNLEEGQRPAQAAAIEKAAYQVSCARPPSSFALLLSVYNAAH